ncbi:hypothetical protein PS645_04643 [Pseudomonas fluorescens]|uniref:Uncharacterized protein n=1 Tax=Pseudomonas fluorescens TaxID=294 RepID=A0A5E6WEV0_PSEFL|nr:hypothetical protein PS645_04643 [Pseudomonas fluorescens]
MVHKGLIASMLAPTGIEFFQKSCDPLWERACSRWRWKNQSNPRNRDHRSRIASVRAFNTGFNR